MSLAGKLIKDFETLQEDKKMEVIDFVAFECYTPEQFDKKSGSPIKLSILAREPWLFNMQ
ncbi:MAG: hypothetical protein H7Y18_21035 [Clostridiaceae bacterium]|nr:hypothetical protein [Clostridiaceae bacterium]